MTFGAISSLVAEVTHKAADSMTNPKVSLSWTTFWGMVGSVSAEEWLTTLSIAAVLLNLSYNAWKWRRDIKRERSGE